MMYEAIANDIERAIERVKQDPNSVGEDADGVLYGLGMALAIVSSCMVAELPKRPWIKAETSECETCQETDWASVETFMKGGEAKTHPNRIQSMESAELVKKGDVWGLK